MEVGKLFFTNTGWPHRVFNKGSVDRLNLVFGVPFSDIERWFERGDGEIFQ